MTWRGSCVQGTWPRAVVAAVALACLAPCAVADPPAARAGGLVPAPRKTREELVREWDLNSDGTIDHGEAEVASSRMRRERAELRLNSGLDPVTGLPRGESPDLLATAGEDAVEPSMPDEEPAPEADPERDDERPLPGTRVPRREPAPATRRPTEERRGGRQQPVTEGAATAGESRRPIIGGARAGGMPARPGYGSSLPTAPLNAGLPIPPRAGPTAGPGRPRAGLVPAPRQPVRPVPPPPRPAGPREMYDPY